MPKFLIVRSMINIEESFVEDQKEYQSKVGMLLFLVKYYRRDVANTTRELSKANDGANLAVFQELLQVIRYVLNTKYLGIKLEPTRYASKFREIIWFNNIDYT